ncbi:MAG: formylglycine-generating enzyme family protein, partial [Ktedonobacterales bacterium]
AYALRLAGASAEEVRRCDEALRLARDEPEWRARRVVALTMAGHGADAQAEMDQIARESAPRGDADGAPHPQAESRALRMELSRAARLFGEARSAEERLAAAEAFGALLTRNAPNTPLRDDPLSPQRLQPPQLPERLARLGYVMRPFGEVEAILPPLCEVAAGPCLLSEGAAWGPEVAARDLPHQWVTLAGFQIARYPVTVAEYACFARAQRREPQRWENGGQRLGWQTQLERPDHPVVCVTWHDALAYAAWLSELTGQRWRLPTEAEWEKAARWDVAAQKALAYPWGDDFDAARCNCATAIGQTTEVGRYPAGASPCGALNLSGNVWEWTSNLAGDGAAEANLDAEPVEIAMLRGGSWFSPASEVSGVARRACLPYG